MENTKRKQLLIILFILILLVAGLLCFLITRDNDVKKIDTPKKEAPVANPDQDIVMEKVLKYKLFGLSYYDEEIDLSTDELIEPKLELLYAYVEDKLSDSDANAYFRDLYGKVPTEHKSYICPLDNKELLSYDEKNETYYINNNHPGHGGRIYDPLDYKVIDFKEDNNIITISVIFLYGNNADGFYTNDQEFISDVDPDINGDGEFTDDEYQEYINKIKEEFKKTNEFDGVKKYVYTFEKVAVDNSYEAQYLYSLKGFKKSI